MQQKFSQSDPVLIDLLNTIIYRFDRVIFHYEPRICWKSRSGKSPGVKRNFWLHIMYACTE